MCRNPPVYVIEKYIDAGAGSARARFPQTRSSIDLGPATSEQP
jgi:hypothetical protein